jgi:hypothetical protein
MGKILTISNYVSDNKCFYSPYSSPACLHLTGSIHQDDESRPVIMDDYQADPSGKCRHDGNPKGELFGRHFLWVLSLLLMTKKVPRPWVREPTCHDMSVSMKANKN